MARHRVDHRRVRHHLLYTVEEFARTVGVHKHTVLMWKRDGLAPVEERRPFLFHGGTAVEFLKARSKKSKRPCSAGQLYCVRCRVPRAPVLDMADYIPMTPTGGNLRGLCPSCDAYIFRRVSLARLDAVKGNLDIKFMQRQAHINDRSEHSVNIDSKGASEQ